MRHTAGPRSVIACDEAHSFEMIDGACGSPETGPISLFGAVDQVSEAA